MRRAITRLIAVLMKMTSAYQVISTTIENHFSKIPDDTITDLGSGAGSTMPNMLKKLKEKPIFKNTKLILTDLYPNAEAITFYNNPAYTDITYKAESVNAVEMNSEMPGLKTMINSFHHLNENDAYSLLSNAQKNNQSVFIYEMTDNKLPLFLWWLFLPVSLVILFVMVLFMTPFARPLTWYQLLFTYVIPLIPVFYAWDGQASMPRIYGLKDLKFMTEKLKNDSDTGNAYTWHYGAVSKGGIYLAGVPESR